MAVVSRAERDGAYGADHYDDMESMCGPAPLPCKKCLISITFWRWRIPFE